MEEEVMQDITETGPVGLKGLKGINQQQPKSEEIPFYQLLENLYSTQGAIATLKLLQGSATEDITEPLLQQGFGLSRFDKRLSNELELVLGLDDFRANEQSALGKIANGLAKGVVLAGTTFLDGTVGLVNGAVTKIKTGEEGSLWNNDFSRTLKEINDNAEKVFPNYYTAYELELPWYKNAFTANFLGDKFIKNLGFTIGAFYSGGLATKGLKLTRLPQLMGAITKSSKAPAIVNAAVGATVSAVNEGRIEALNNSTDWFNLNKQKLDDKYMQVLQNLQGLYGNSPEYFNYAKLAEQSYNEDLAKLSEDLAKMGNADLLMNLPILLASNLFEFGKLYANGFKTARRTTNIAKTGAEYSLERSALRGWAKGLGNALSEGSEEMLQKAASLAAGNYYNNDIENFYRAKIDPDASQRTLSWTKAMAEAINETVNDGSSWEEFTIGALTGFLGMPTFGRTANTNQKTYLGKGRTIGLTGGFFGDVKEYNEETERQQQIVDYLNGRISSPEFKNYYQGLVRHQQYQTLMDAATIKDDAFNFKNAEHALLVSDIMMFANAGKTEDLVTLVNSAFDTSDENLESIAKNTTTTDEKNGQVIGPFVDSKGNPLYSTPEGKLMMIDLLTKSKDEILNTINKYNEVINTIDSRTGEALTDELLEELAWIKLQQANWQDRAVEMSGEAKQAIGRVIGILELGKRQYLRIINEEGLKSADLTPEYKEAAKQLKKLDSWISTLDFTRGIPDEGMIDFLSSTPNFTKQITDLIDTLNEEENIIDVDTANTITSLFEDLNKIRKGNEIYNAKFKEYLDNPEKITETHKATELKIVKEEVDKNKAKLRATVDTATNLTQLRETVKNTDNPELMATVLDEMENEGNQLVKDYRETGRYLHEVESKIRQSDASTEAKEDAITLVRNQFDKSDNLSELANPEGFAINDDLTFAEDSGFDQDVANARFLEAKYVALEAMHIVNNNDKFKDTFSEAYKKPPIKADTTLGVTSSTTGNDGTATIPSVNTAQPTTTVTTEAPVGNDTFEDISKENSKVEGTPTEGLFKELTKRFYMPAIPELDIDSAKVGKMVPFDEAQRAKGMNFDAIYNHLKSAGAFDYVNRGLLKVGDTIEFMIDPSFNNTTIFMVTKKSDGTYQVVGSLLESAYKTKEFAGLDSLQKDIYDAYKAEGGAGAKYYYKKKTTNVSLILIGKIPYQDKELNLKDIPDVVSATGEAPKFAIMKSGRLVSPEVNNSDIIYPMNTTSAMEGRLYLLVKNAAGKYSPVAVRVKHFNNKEFNTADLNNPAASTIIGNEINEAIGKIARALLNTDEALLREGVKEFGELVYSEDLFFNFETGRLGTYLSITKTDRNADGSPIMKLTASGNEVLSESKIDNIYTTNYKGEPNSLQEIFNQIYNSLQSVNLPLQVNAKLINKEGYNQRLISSDILTSNISQAVTLNSFFITDYFADGKLQPASKIPNVEPKVTATTPVGGSKSAISGTKVRSVYSGSTYYIDNTNHTIKDLNGNNVAINNGNQILFDIAWAYENYPNTTDVPGVMTGNKIITPNGKVLDLTNQKYLTGAAEVAVKLKLKNNQQETTLKTQNSVETPAIFKPNTTLQQGAVTDASVNDANNTNEVGMYILNDALHRGKLAPLANIAGVNIYYTTIAGETLTEEGVFDADSSKTSEVKIPTNNYIVIFPNGQALLLITNWSRTDEEAKENIIKALNGNPDRIKTLTTQETVLTKVSEVTSVEEQPILEGPNTMLELAEEGNKLLLDLQDEDDEYLPGNTQMFLRKVSEEPLKVWDLKKELAWLNKVLPQLSQQDRIRVAKGLIKVGETGTTAWGMLDKGIVTLSDIAAEGTAYHEAFHVVFNLLLDEKERQVLYKEAKLKFGDKSDIELEEDMAEGFREYVMSRDSRSWGQKIIDFFKDLYAKVTNWKALQPSLTAYYRMINGGKYVRDALNDSDVSELATRYRTISFNNIDSEIKEVLVDRGWTEDKWNSISEDERLHAIKCYGV